MACVLISSREIAMQAIYIHFIHRSVFMYRSIYVSQVYMFRLEGQADA